MRASTTPTAKSRRRGGRLTRVPRRLATTRSQWRTMAVSCWSPAARVLVAAAVFAVATGLVPERVSATPQGNPAPNDKGTAPAQQQQAANQAQREVEEDEFLKLGVDEDFQAVERSNTVAQINSFIPPLYQPAFAGHGYVLPPGALRVGAGPSFFDVNSSDFFKGGEEDFVHEQHSVNRMGLDINIFLGLPRNMTLFVNVPYWTSTSRGYVHPAGVKVMDLFVEGNTQKIGDVQVIVKKKWVDQGNFYFNLATVMGLKLPTGSNDEPFIAPMTVKNPMGVLGPAFGGGPFPRFADDGRLPLSLQPGTGGFGYIFGVMGTRQFNGFRGALHGGTLIRILNGADGAEPGDEVRFFASFVKPIAKEQLSVDLTFNGMYRGDDSYEGTFTHPMPDADGGFAGMVTTPRPAFQGGTVMFFSPSLIWSPDPQVRFTGTYSLRLNQPNLGPWPSSIFRFGVSYTFSVTNRRFGS